MGRLFLYDSSDLSSFRANDETVLKTVFKSAKLVTSLLDAFEPLSTPEISAASSSAESSVVDPGASSRCSLSNKDKRSLRGFVINSTNAIRLQVGLSPSPLTSSLRSILLTCACRCCLSRLLHFCGTFYTRTSAGTSSCLFSERLPTCSNLLVWANTCPVRMEALAE